MSDLLVKPTDVDAKGRSIHVTPESAGWTYVGFDVHKLESGQDLRVGDTDREICIVLLSGFIDLQFPDQKVERFGKRETIFDDAPACCIYLPPGDEVAINANGDAEIALCSAPGSSGFGRRLIQSDEISRETRGQGTNTRHVNALLAGPDDAASLIIFEVYTPSGHWSSYPPHKHDQDAIPEESALEETYYHRLNPPQGFAFQRVYTDSRDIDETMTVEDGDTVLVPRGYHPVGAPHGYDLYYLNVMAGPKRKWIFKNDPAHEWMLKQS